MNTTRTAPVAALIALCALLLPFAAACAAASEGRTAAEAAGGPPVSMTLTRASGGALSVEDLRGRPLLIMLFSTYDLGSQAAITPLLDFHERHPDARILGIAVQPDPARLLPHFANALGIPFTLAFHPNGVIRKGESALGTLQAVPTFIALDARGRIAARHVGYAELETLQSLWATASRPGS